MNLKNMDLQLDPQSMFKNIKEARRVFAQFVNRESYNENLLIKNMKTGAKASVQTHIGKLQIGSYPTFDNKTKSKFVLDQYKKLNLTGLTDGDVVRAPTIKKILKDYPWNPSASEFTYVRTYNAGYKLKDSVFTSNNP